MSVEHEARLLRPNALAQCMRMAHGDAWRRAAILYEALPHCSPMYKIQLRGIQDQCRILSCVTDEIWQPAMHRIVAIKGRVMAARPAASSGEDSADFNQCSVNAEMSALSQLRLESLATATSIGVFQEI